MRLVDTFPDTRYISLISWRFVNILPVADNRLVNKPHLQVYRVVRLHDVIQNDRHVQHFKVQICFIFSGLLASVLSQVDSCHSTRLKSNQSRKIFWLTQCHISTEYFRNYTNAESKVHHFSKKWIRSWSHISNMNLMTILSSNYIFYFNNTLCFLIPILKFLLTFFPCRGGSRNFG